MNSGDRLKKRRKKKNINKSSVYIRVNKKITNIMRNTEK